MEILRILMESQPRKLLDQVRDTIRLKHYSYRTEQSYVYWIRRYILFHNKRHPKEMSSAELEAFLIHLAVKEQVAASTQNQALNAVVFLYRDVLKQELGIQTEAVRAKRTRYLPTVLTKEEVLTVIQNLSGVYQLVVQLLYGSGLRLTEAVQLRVKDLDFGQQQVIVRDGKGMNSRATILPQSLTEPLQAHLSGRSQAATSAGSRQRLWVGVSSICLRAQISQCGLPMDMAVCISIRSALTRSTHWYHPSSSSP